MIIQNQCPPTPSVPTVLIRDHKSELHFLAHHFTLGIFSELSDFLLVCMHNSAIQDNKMKIISFAILLLTLSQTIHCEEGLNLRENTSQCWNRNLLKKHDSKTQKTALASLPGKYLKITTKNRDKHIECSKQFK